MRADEALYYVTQSMTLVMILSMPPIIVASVVGIIISLLQALVMDMALAAFYMAYAFVFNWAYDRVFPLPEWQEAKA